MVLVACFVFCQEASAIGVDILSATLSVQQNTASPLALASPALSPPPQ